LQIAHRMKAVDSSFTHRYERSLRHRLVVVRQENAGGQVRFNLDNADPLVGR
jgi:hypothetical protein